MKSTLAIKLLLASLSHRLRTPLSVVSNDLQYFHKKAPQLEADKTLNSVNGVVQILSETENIIKNFFEIVDTKNHKKLFELIIQILCDEYRWSIDSKTQNCLKFSMSCDKVVNFDNNFGIAELYINTFQQESIKILLIDSACDDLGITQKVTTEGKHIKLIFEHI